VTKVRSIGRENPQLGIGRQHKSSAAMTGARSALVVTKYASLDIMTISTLATIVWRDWIQLRIVIVAVKSVL
jgi:hypothetical protein